MLKTKKFSSKTECIKKRKKIQVKVRTRNIDFCSISFIQFVKAFEIFSDPVV